MTQETKRPEICCECGADLSTTGVWTLPCGLLACGDGECRRDHTEEGCHDGAPADHEAIKNGEDMRPWPKKAKTAPTYIIQNMDNWMLVAQTFPTTIEAIAHLTDRHMSGRWRILEVGAQVDQIGIASALPGPGQQHLR